MTTAQKFVAYLRWQAPRDVAWSPGWGWTPGYILVDAPRRYWNPCNEGEG